MDLRKNGDTSNTVRFYLSKISTGLGFTGLGIASSGLIISTIANNESTATAYTAAGSTIETISTLGTFAAPTATKCRFKEVDATNHPGLYEFQFADARFSVSNAKRLTITVSGVSDLKTENYLIFLGALDWHSATAFITGINSLAPPSNWNLDSIDSNGRRDVIKVAGTTQTARDLGASVLLSSGTGTGQLDFTSGVVKSNLSQILGTALTETSGLIAAGFKKFFNVASPTGTLNSLPDAVPDAAGGLPITGTRLTALGDARIANLDGTITSRAAASVFTGITSLAQWLGAMAGKQTASSTAITEIRATGAGSGTFDETTDSQEAIRDNIGTAGAGLTAADDAVITAIGALNNLSQANVRTAVGLASANLDTQLDALPTNAELATALLAADDAVLAAIAALNNIAAGAAMTLTSGERNSIADALFARSLGTESVSADGAVPTLAQAMFELLAKLGEFSISGTTITYKKRDGTTTLFTATLDSSSSPTAITRAT